MCLRACKELTVFQGKWVLFTHQQWKCHSFLLLQHTHDFVLFLLSFYKITWHSLILCLPNSLKGIHESRNIYQHEAQASLLSSALWSLQLLIKGCGLVCAKGLKEMGRRRNCENHPISSPSISTHTTPLRKASPSLTRSLIWDWLCHTTQIFKRRTKSISFTISQILPLNVKHWKLCSM